VSPSVELEVLVGKKVFLVATGIRATDHCVRNLVATTTKLPWLLDYDLRQNYVLRTYKNNILTLNLPTTTIVAQPFNIIKWQLKFNPVA